MDHNCPTIFCKPSTVYSSQLISPYILGANLRIMFTVTTHFAKLTLFAGSAASLICTILLKKEKG